MRAIVARTAGGPEVLDVVDLPEPVPGSGELLVRVAAAGVNFIDTYQRSGVYPVGYPYPLGLEGSGVVEAVGDNTKGFAVGDRVAWADACGSYAELAIVRVADALVVADGLGLDVAAALPLQGMTAHYLANSTYPIRPGDDVLVHAGAGGVGLLLTQLAAGRGARVITTVSTEAKERLSTAAGAADIIRYERYTDLATQLPADVRAMTGGQGVHVVYDSVGKDTFDASLASLRRRGLLVLFGAASGQVPMFDLQRLNRAGSLYVTRPTLGDYTATRAELTERADDLFGSVLRRELNVRIGARFPLGQAADAHRALEGRATTGKVLLVPDGSPVALG